MTPSPLSASATPAMPASEREETETETETYQALMLLADRKTGRIPSDLLVRHVISVTSGSGWPVKRAAVEATLRRLAAAARDGLAVASAPRGGLGLFTTRRKGGRERPYKTLLLEADPLRGSCDCRDYGRNSLGLCKHVLTALAVHLSRRKGEDDSRSPEVFPRLTWDPIRPLTGPGDWLDRVTLVETAGGNGAKGGATGTSPTSLRALFSRQRAGVLGLVATHAGDAARRLDLIERLLGLLGLVDGGRGSRGDDRARRGASASARSRRRDAGGVSADPALVALLQAERDRLAPAVRRLPGAAEIRRELKSLERPLYPYQLEGVRRFLASGRLVLADDMGLGKTAQAIAVGHVLFRTKKVQRGLLIVPTSLKDQWLREWRLFSDTPLTAVDGRPEERAALYRRTARGFLVTNYEQVLRDLAIIERWKPDLVVLDEAQRIKNWATKTAAYVKTLAPSFRLVLTGTPMENRLEELASILDWVDDLALEPKWRLTPLHAELADGRREVVGARHLDTLRSRLSGCLLRRRRSEVLRQLPSRTDTFVPVAITEPQAARHAELDLPIARLLSMAKKRPLSPGEFLRLMSLLTTQRIIANGMAQLDFEEIWPALAAKRRVDEATLAELATPKLSHLREILAQVVVQQGRKAVVFSQWRRMLTLSHWAVSDLLSDAGLSASFFTGQESAKRRTQNIVDFHDDPKTAVLFATDAGGVGLNLQRAASCCVNIDLPWNPAVLEQRIGRIHRLGQKRPIDVYDLVTESSIEARIAGLVADKKAFFSGLFDGDSNEVRFTHASSFLSRLERIVEPTRVPEREVDEASPEEVASGEREVDTLLARGEEEGALGAAVAPGATGAPAGPAAWLAQLQIRRREDGGLHIDAPPEAAEGLAILFEGMGKLLRDAARGAGG